MNRVVFPCLLLCISCGKEVASYQPPVTVTPIPTVLPTATPMYQSPYERDYYPTVTPTAVPTIVPAATPTAAPVPVIIIVLKPVPVAPVPTIYPGVNPCYKQHRCQHDQYQVP